MKKIFLALIAAGATLPVAAQVQISEMMRSRLSPNSVYLERIAQALPETAESAIHTYSAGQQPSATIVPVAITLRDGASTDALEAAGLQVDFVQGKYVFGFVSLDLIDAVAAADGVEAIELQQVARMLNDKSRAETRVDDVHSGLDLPQAYTGKDVVVGIFDGGLDPNHITFKTSDLSASRVKSIWKYSNYGSETAYTTESKIASFTTDESQETHGTHVLATMAGAYDTGVSGKRLYGVATDADIVIGCGALTTSTILKGVKRITEYAASVGKPCVINLSLGINDGPHDGSDSFCSSLEDYTTDPNTTICIASGNEGDTGCGLITKFPEGSPSVRTCIMPNYNLEYYYSTSNLQAYDEVQIWGEDSTPFEVKVLCVNYKTGEKLGEFEVTTTSRTTSMTSAEGFKSYFNAGSVTAARGVNSQNNRYYATVNLKNIVSKSSTAFNTYCLALEVTGTAGKRVDFYSTLQSFVSNGLVGYTASDGNGTFNSWAACKGIFVVGAECVNNYKPFYFESGSLGDPIGFSSFGTLLDGTELPQIIAPGSVILSAMSSYYYSYSQSYERYYSKSVDGKTYYWMPMQGTSMATPHMAGICALWLQADPTLTSNELIEVAKLTAKPVNNPSMQAGAGIVDAYAGIQHILNMGGVENVKADEAALMVKPLGGNRFEAFVPGATEFVLYNLQGISALSVAAADNSAVVDASSLPAGLYVLTAVGPNVRQSQKLVIR